jgi:thioredoxin 1
MAMAENVESLRPRRNLYTVEIVLGIVMLGLVALIFYNNSAPSGIRSKTEDANIVTLTPANWQTEVVDSKVPVVVDFWAPWCGPCKALSPIIDRIAAQYAGKIKVGKVNIDEAPGIAQRYGIDSIPRVFIFNGGDQPRRVITGLTSEANLASAIDSVLQ